MDVTGISVGVMVAVGPKVVVTGGGEAFVAGNVAVNTGGSGSTVTKVWQPPMSQMSDRIIKSGCRFMILRIAQQDPSRPEARG